MAKWRLGAHCGAARCAPGNGPFGAIFISLTVEIIFLAANPGNCLIGGLPRLCYHLGGWGRWLAQCPCPPHGPKMGARRFLAHVVGRRGLANFGPPKSASLPSPKRQRLPSPSTPGGTGAPVWPYQVCSAHLGPGPGTMLAVTCVTGIAVT